MKKYDLYELRVDEETIGMYTISLVEEPAVLRKWLAFKKDEKPEPLKLSVQDEEKHKILGVVLRADFPIYRYDDWGEYYIVFRKDEIEKITRMFLLNGFQNAVNTDHNSDAYLSWEDIEIEQLFIKDEKLGINPAGFEDIPEGSLFALYKIKNDKLWEMIKEGKWNGFSMEGYYKYIPAGEVGEEADKTTEEEWESFLESLTE